MGGDTPQHKGRGEIKKNMSPLYFNFNFLDYNGKCHSVIGQIHNYFLSTVQSPYHYHS